MKSFKCKSSLHPWPFLYILVVFSVPQQHCSSVENHRARQPTIWLCGLTQVCLTPPAGDLTACSWLGHHEFVRNVNLKQILKVHFAPTSPWHLLKDCKTPQPRRASEPTGPHGAWESAFLTSSQVRLRILLLQDQCQESRGKQCCSNFITKHPGIMLNYRFWIHVSQVRPNLLHL